MIVRAALRQFYLVKHPADVATNMTPTIYLTIEESARELDAKLLVAGIAAESGFDVIVGQQWLLNFNWQHLPPGVVVFKGNNAVQHVNIRNAKRAGHRIATLEEEALGVVDAAEIRRLYSSGVEADCDLLFMQGEFQRQALAQRFPSAAERMIVTGNPRIDLLRPLLLKAWQAESDCIRNRFGRFILVNTNYATINSHWGDMLSYYDVAVNAQVFRPNNREDDELFDEQVAWERTNIQAMINLVRLLEADTPSIPIVIRPHPSERLDSWEYAFAGRSRIHVVREGHHLPWTLASEILVHTSCTTGAEAFIAGRPSIGLRVGSSRFHDFFLSNLVNPTFESPIDAGRFIAAHFLDQSWFTRDRKERWAALDSQLASTSGPLAAERLVEGLSSVIPVPQDRGSWSPGAGFATERHLSKLLASKAVMTAETLRGRLLSLGRLLDRFENLAVTEVGQLLYRIQGLR